jgi:hypothetical protein
MSGQCQSTAIALIAVVRGFTFSMVSTAAAVIADVTGYYYVNPISGANSRS